MASTEEVTPYYIRNSDGDTFFVDTLAEALEAFLNNERGYRLTLRAGKDELVLRRTSGWTQVFIGDIPIDEKEGTAHMISRIRG